MSEPYFKENMTGQEFFQNQIDASSAFETPLEIKLPSDLEKIKALCELCKLQEEGFCCPEHCCDVSKNNKLMVIKCSGIPVAVNIAKSGSKF